MQCIIKIKEPAISGHNCLAFYPFPASSDLFYFVFLGMISKFKQNEIDNTQNFKSIKLNSY